MRSTYCAFGCHLAILSSSMMESHVVISTPFDAAKRMSYLAGGRAAMSTCMLGRSSVAISEGGGVRSLGRVGEDDALR